MKTLTRKRIPPTRYPRTAEVDYRRALIRVYTAWFNTIIRALKESPEFIGLKEVRQDSNFNDIFDRARDRWGEESQKLASDLHRMTENVNRTSYISITGQKKAAGKSMGIDLGVGAIPFDPDIQGEIDASLRENVRLIKNLGTQSLDKIETMVTDTVRQGKLTKDLQKQLMDEYGATKRRAALIATDQVGKLNGNINRLRQKKAGVKQYTWNSMQDNRVRPEHAKRNGQVFSWDSPPPDGHPGTPIRCRCTPTPIFNDAEDFGLTPEEIAEDLAEQGLIEARQRAAIEARIKASAERKAKQTQANRAKGAKKAAKTRAKNKQAEKAKPKRPNLSQTWDNPPTEERKALKAKVQEYAKSDKPHERHEAKFAERYFDVLTDIDAKFASVSRKHTRVQVDVYLKSALLEVSIGSGGGKTGQVIRYNQPNANPFLLPVIVFLDSDGFVPPNRVRDIEKAGSTVVKSIEELDELVEKIHASDNQS